MLTTTDRTPAEIVALERKIAEKVMGWKQSYPGCSDVRSHVWRDTAGNSRYIGEPLQKDHHLYWSPWENPADALQVLERLQELDNPEGHSGIAGYYKITQFQFDEGRDWGVTYRSEVIRICGGLLNLGPVVCTFAEKVLKENTKGC